jgi:hypothetical protein
MRRLLRKIAIFVIAAGVASSGATPHSQATISSAGADAAALHETHSVQRYADLAIEAGDDDSLPAAVHSPTRHSHDDGLCKQCCSACVSASLVPDAPFPILILSETRGTYSTTLGALVAHSVPTDPGIPKPL